MARIITILDCNNFWSPSGGGVRRYHLEKLKYFKASPNIYVFMMQDEKTFTEVINETTIIEHIKAPKFRGNWDYRFLISSKPIIKILEKHKPQVIEVGSPYIMPLIVKRALKKTGHKSVLLSFWHADFPVTYVGRYFTKWAGWLGKVSEKLAWGFARWMFKEFDGFMVSSKFIGSRMEKNRIHNIFWVPLGVDTKQFTPNKRDIKLNVKLKDGQEERLTFFFPHRFMEEKGLRTLLKAYPNLCIELKTEPTLVFAGTGPDLELVKEAEKKYKHIHYNGFIESPDEMAKWYASCDMGLALSGHETFGLSILESMASGQVLVGANTGAAMEHIVESEAGLTIPIGDPEALVKAVVHLKKKSNQKMSKKSRQYAEKFTWEKCFERQMDVYQILVNQKKL